VDGRALATDGRTLAMDGQRWLPTGGAGRGGAGLAADGRRTRRL